MDNRQAEQSPRGTIYLSAADGLHHWHGHRCLHLSRKCVIISYLLPATTSCVSKYVYLLINVCIFADLSGIYSAIAVTPISTQNLGRVFFTEYVTTFILTYTAFTVAFEDAENQKKESMSFKTISDSKGLTLYASNPQSKTGFAPFSIGLTIFSLSLVGGSSGGLSRQMHVINVLLIKLCNILVATKKYFICTLKLYKYYHQLLILLLMLTLLRPLILL